MIKKSIFIWLSIIPLAILNAGFRERIFTPLIGSKYSLPISGITLCILIFIVSMIFTPKLGKGDPKTYGYMGLLWVSLTLIFETGIGFLMEKTVNEILKAYDITTGNLWLLVVIFIGCAPRLAKIKF
jgi:hypothetical protein